MCRRKLCPNCETGRRAYELDSKSTECPYLPCHNGKECCMYKKMKKEYFKKFCGLIKHPDEKKSS